MEPAAAMAAAAATARKPLGDSCSSQHVRQVLQCMLVCLH
jgi:hypothetical protein